MTREPTSSPALPLDTAFELLTNAYRRHILYYFHDGETKIATLDDLCKHLQNTLDEDSSEHQIHLRLHHQHLPKLVDHNVLEYDVRSETVRYRGESRLEALLVIARRLETTV
ncbi:DUF7344 domain-containing protein [Haladaptatus halobius]|uniref:DUF7344 domain-containing protein n=1 Tax=Haladaptatus halobius TaxID=2884875 RepID=UPI001D0A032B|nr:hypothetical protein [Haladaptatus halobius]